MVSDSTEAMKATEPIFQLFLQNADIVKIKRTRVIAGCRADQTECESATYLIEVAKEPIASGTGATLATTAANPKASAEIGMSFTPFLILSSMKFPNLLERL